MKWKWFYWLIVGAALALLVAKVVIEESGEGRKSPLWMAYAFVGIVAIGTVASAVRLAIRRAGPSRSDGPEANPPDRPD